MKPQEDNKEKDELNPEKKALNNYVRFSGIGFQMIVIIGIFTFIGYEIDKRRTSATPLFTALFSLIGVCIAMYIVIRSLKNLKS